MDGKSPRQHHKETPAEHRKRIAKEAEEACHLKDNVNGPDLDEGGYTDGRHFDSDLA